MADEISYFEVAAFLAEIEPDYAKYLDPIEWKQRLVLAARERWPTRVTREGKRRWPSTGSVAKILAATGASLGDFVALVGDERMEEPSRRFPIIGLDQAAEDEFFDAGGRPTGDGWGAMLFPQLTDPGAYALKVDNNRLAPVYREGDVLILSPRADLRRRDRVVVKLRDGEILVGQLMRKGVRRVRLAPIVGGKPERALDADQVAWISRVLWASQ